MLAVPTDVRSFDACAGAIAATIEHFGRLDILVNCAGVWVEGPSDTMTETDAGVEVKLIIRALERHPTNRYDSGEVS